MEGDYRERFALIYYNQAKLIYGAEEALALVEEKVGLMEKPLSKAELYWAINHTEEHEENNMPELHGDGVFLFNRETIAGENWLGMIAEEEESCSIFRTRNKNAHADQNRSVKKERDELAGYDVVFIDGSSMLKASHMENAIDLLRKTKKRSPDGVERAHKCPREKEGAEQGEAGGT